MADSFFDSAAMFGPSSGSAGSTISSNYAGAAADLFGGGGILGSSLAGAAGSNAAATAYGYAQTFTKEQTALEETLAGRQIYQAQSTAQAGIAGNGFQLGGSAGDILRSNAQQGALTKGAIALQGAAQEQAYLEQQKAAKGAATGQIVGGVLGVLGDAAKAAAAVAGG